jgi:23S rRNA (pseudouridine1915-N3)-methyltransferase
MKLTIISIGKFENSPHRTVFETYLKRLKWKIELKEFELKNSQNFSVEKIKKCEGELILKALHPSSKLIVLDENGKQFKSRDFAKLISDFAVRGDSDLTFVIGGANGLSDEVLKKSSLKVSLGLMTFPHLMVRSILVEQLYRASTIIDGHPYHRE